MPLAVPHASNEPVIYIYNMLKATLARKAYQPLLITNMSFAGRTE